MRMLGDSPAAAAAVDASSAPLLVTPASAAATPAGGGSDASFDADMVFILAAMLCVLACAIGLNSLIAYFRLQCGRRSRTLITVAAPHAAAVAMAASSATDDAGLKKRELSSRIPVVVYHQVVKGAGVSASECAICLGEFDDGDKVRVLPRCHHGFHVECIDMWLATKPSCPTCRNSLLEPATAAGEEGRW